MLLHCDIATLTFVCILVTTLLVWWQAREATRARTLEAMLMLHERVSSTAARDDRGVLYDISKHGWPEPPDSIPDCQRKAIERICVDSDVLGNLVECGLIPERQFLLYHFDVIIQTYEAAEPFILWRRKNSRFGHYVPAFEKLYRRARRYVPKEGQGRSCQHDAAQEGESVAAPFPPVS